MRHENIMNSVVSIDIGNTLASQQYLVCEMIQQTYVRVSYSGVSDSGFH
jgi:hypothetical protein